MVNNASKERTDFEDPHRHRMLTYWIIGAVVLVLFIVALIARRTNEKTEAAQAKATQLQQAFIKAGLPPPSTEQIVNVLGEDGAVVCQDPKAALSRAIHYGVSTNGAGGPGLRPVYTPRQLVTGAELVLTVYCPEKLPEFQENVDDLKLSDTAGDGTS
jgi:hypothetical protein